MTIQKFRLKAVFISLSVLIILTNYNCRREIKTEQNIQTSKAELLAKLNLFNQEFRLTHPEYYSSNDYLSKKPRKSFWQILGIIGGDVLGGLIGTLLVRK